MPVFKLSNHIQFPDPSLAEENGLLAIGGDLKPERLLLAYSMGIFPWYSTGDPILWWFTAPRLVIFLNEFHIPRRVIRFARNSKITTTIDRAFPQVIYGCCDIRRQRGEETWILPEMEAAYTQLHRLGYAHSIECWEDGQLVGGLYGVSLGKIFFGESMFSKAKSASQLALISLVKYLVAQNFKMIDCQMTTQHLLRFGAREISGEQFQKILHNNIKNINFNDKWKNESYIC